MAINSKILKTQFPKKFKKPQKGVSLIELLVGIVIGLMVVAVAMGALIASRGVSGAVSDASQLQQQASFIFRTFGLQVRQAGGLFLNLAPAGASTAVGLSESATPVSFETQAASVNGGNTFTPKTDTINGQNNALTVGYRRYLEPVFTSSTDISISRNCLGGPADGVPDTRLESIFVLVGTDLRCSGNATVGGPQPIAQNVASFSMKYLQMSNLGSGNPKVKYVDAATAQSNWSQITGVEVCLTLFGNEPIEVPSGGGYVDCDGASVDISTLSSPRRNKMHRVFKNVFQIRSQGTI